MSQNSLGGAADLRPSENEIAAARKNAIRRKYRLLTILITTILLAALIALFVSQCSGPPKQREWSEWMDELPEYATAENYLIEEQKLYRSRTLQTTSSTEQSSMPGWELYNTVTGPGPWSNWSETEIAGSDTIEVQTETHYHYRDIERTTSSDSAMSGWELYDTTYSWGDWSEWSTSPVSSSESRKVETKTQYSYKTKDYTSSNTSSLDGWTLYKVSTDRGEWSSWSDTPISASSTREVETRQVQIGTRYYIAHYCTGNTGDNDKYKSANYKYHDQCAYHELGWFDSLNNFTIVDGTKVLYYPNPNGDKYRCSNSCFYFFIMDTEDIYKTQYKYRTVYTVYHFYQWSDWSDYSDTYVSSSGDREVRTRTLYKHCDWTSSPTYHFWRWGNWSDWSTDAVSRSDSRQVETKVFYRCRDVSATTYYFRRWSDWSDYSSRVVLKSDTVDVETKMQYRYKSK